MANFPKVCLYREITRDRPAGRVMALGPGGPARLAADIRKTWPGGTTLRVRFLEGSPAQQDVVRQFAPEWTDHANLKFDFVTSGSSQIRITFRDDGAWSYIGSDSEGIPGGAATMNFGWFDQGVVLHEFGHAIGMIHEHQNPLGGIQWNRDNVIRDLSGPPNSWDLATIDHNIFRRYDLQHINGTEVDKKSIMLYAIPSHWTLDSFQSDPNDVLSDVDKQHVASVYPGATQPEPVELTVNEPQIASADIGQAGEEDLFRFTVANAGRYSIQTEGSTDTVMWLAGPNDATNAIADDDDSGAGLNPRIAADLQPGDYFVRVRHFNELRGTGSYRIRVDLVPSAAATATA